jgi:hypothetical protein
MIKIHIFGHLKKKFDKNARLSENTTITLPHINGENFHKLLKRLDLAEEEIGDCFLNHKVITDKKATIIPDESRVAIFSGGMFLLCGGQHLKGHGFIKKSYNTEVDYY